MSENRLERERESDQRKQEVKCIKRAERKAQESYKKDAKMGRMRREECEIE